MLAYVVAAVLLGVVPASEPGSAESEQSLAAAAGSGKRLIERAQHAAPERPVCSGLYVEPDPAIDAGMLRAGDADLDPAIVRRPDCGVELGASADGDARGSRLEHGPWLTLEVPRRHVPERSHVPEPPNPEPPTETPKP